MRNFLLRHYWHWQNVEFEMQVHIDHIYFSNFLPILFSIAPCWSISSRSTRETFASHDTDAISLKRSTDYQVYFIERCISKIPINETPRV